MDTTRPGKRPLGSEIELNVAPLRRTKRRRVAPARGELVSPATRILGQFYPRVLSLREYVLSALPKTSRQRRRKICRLGRSTPRPHTEIEAQLNRLLDSIVIGAPLQVGSQQDERPEDKYEFSQVGDDSTVTLADGLEKAFYSQGTVSTSMRHL
jgi:hypothetical protein